MPTNTKKQIVAFAPCTCCRSFYFFFVRHANATAFEVFVMGCRDDAFKLLLGFKEAYPETPDEEISGWARMVVESTLPEYLSEGERKADSLSWEKHLQNPAVRDDLQSTITCIIAPEHSGIRPI